MFRHSRRIVKNKPNFRLITGIALAGLCTLSCCVLWAISAFYPVVYKYSLSNTSLAIGGKAPDFELTTLKGDTITLSQFQGRPVLLTFGATWCPDCRVEAPLLEELHKKHPELVILLVDSGETSKAVQQFVDEFNITHEVALDPDKEVMRLYEVFAIPTELFIDKDGIIQAKIIEKVTYPLLVKNLPLIGITP